MRAVLDVNVYISALLSQDGAPARILAAWLNGTFDVVVSPMLIGELRRALAYPKLRRRIPRADADRLVGLLLNDAIQAADPGAGSLPYRSPDPDDDYLIWLAAASQAVLVSGDSHLLALADRAPIHTPAEFVDLIGDR